MDLKTLAQDYAQTLNTQLTLRITLQHQLQITYQNFDYIPFIDENNIVHIVKDILADKLFTTERKINYAKISQTSENNVTEITVNYILNNDNIKEVLENKEINND